MELLWLQFTIILSSNECLWPSIPLLCFCSGITLTKLVGVVVLCFAKSELFVVLWSIPLIILIYLLPTSENVKWYFCFAGLLLPNVPGFGYYRILTWACVFACKSIEFYCHSSFYYLSSTCDIQCLITVFFCGLCRWYWACLVHHQYLYPLRRSQNLRLPLYHTYLTDQRHPAQWLI